VSENLAVHARWWRHPPGKALGTVIAVHGWFMGDQRINALALLPGFFFRLGLDVVLYELPYHGRRSPGDTARNALSLFPSPDIARTNEAVAQAISDLRSLSAWIKQETDRPVGVMGISLGGYVSALWASLDRLSFALLMFPLVSMADMAWEILAKHPKRDTPEWKQIRGVTLDDLRKAYAVHCPLSYQPKVAPRRRMIVAGLGDTVVPAEQPGKLWEHWGRPRMYWFPGGHIGHFSQSDALTQIHEFLYMLKLARKRPLEISAPK
jgi:pimeloyl-ACP methyl ester carboxylesterase